MKVPEPWRTSERGADKPDQFANLKEELEIIVGGGGPVPSVEALDKEEDETMSEAREAASEIHRPSAPGPILPTDDDPMDIDSPTEDEQAIGFGPLPRQTAPSPPGDDRVEVMGHSFPMPPVSSSTRRDTAHEIPKPLESPTSPEDDPEALALSPPEAESGGHAESLTGLHASPPDVEEGISPPALIVRGEDNSAYAASSFPESDEAPTPDSFDALSSEEEDPVSENSWSPDPSDIDDDAAFDDDTGYDEYPDSPVTASLPPRVSPLSPLSPDPENDYFPNLSPAMVEETEPMDTFSELRGDSPDDEQSSSPPLPGVDEADDEALGFTPAARAASQEPISTSPVQTDAVRKYFSTLRTYFPSDDDNEAADSSPAAGGVSQDPTSSPSAQMEVPPARPGDNEADEAVGVDPAGRHASRERASLPHPQAESSRPPSSENDSEKAANLTPFPETRPSQLLYPELPLYQPPLRQPPSMAIPTSVYDGPPPVRAEFNPVESKFTRDSCRHAIKDGKLVPFIGTTPEIDYETLFPNIFKPRVRLERPEIPETHHETIDAIISRIQAGLGRPDCGEDTDEDIDELFSEDTDMPDAPEVSKDSIFFPSLEGLIEACKRLPVPTRRDWEELIRPRLSEKKRKEMDAEFERDGFPFEGSPPQASTQSEVESKNAFVLTTRHVQILQMRLRRLDQGRLRARANEVFEQRGQRRKGSLLRREVLPENVREVQVAPNNKGGIPEHRIKEMIEKADAEKLRQDVELQKSVDEEVARQMQAQEEENLKANYENLDKMHADKRSKGKQPASDEMDIDPRPSPKLRLKFPEQASATLDTSESASSSSSTSSSRTVEDHGGPSSVHSNRTSWRPLESTPPTLVRENAILQENNPIKVIDWRLDESLRTISYLVVHPRSTAWWTCVQTRNNGDNFATEPWKWADYARFRYDALQQFDIPLNMDLFDPYTDCVLGRIFQDEKLWYYVPYGMEADTDDASPRTKTEEAKTKNKLWSRKTLTTEEVSEFERGKSGTLQDDWRKKLPQSRPTYSDDVPESSITKWGAKPKLLTIVLEAEELEAKCEAGMRRFQARAEADKKWEAGRQKVATMMKGWF